MIPDSKEPPEVVTSGAALNWPDLSWSLPGPLYPRDRCIHEFIEDHVERTPDAPAVVFEGMCLSYHELNARANELAHDLLNLGVRPEVPVALFMERSLQLAVAELALLKSCAVDVPLDPGVPRDRLAFMLDDTKTRFILTESRYVDALPPLNATMLCLDKLAP